MGNGMFANKLKDALRNTNIAKLSVEIGVNRYALYRILNGKTKRPTFDVVDKLNRYLKNHG